MSFLTEYRLILLISYSFTSRLKTSVCVYFSPRKRTQELRVFVRVYVCVCECVEARRCPQCYGDVCGRGAPVKRAHGKITINV